MNKPKFRAWDEYHEKLVEVASIDFDNGICLVRDVECDVYSVHWDNLTLMQYTGLNDKNGVEIYKGDYIRCKQYVGGNFVDYHYETGYVDFKVGAFGLHRKQGFYRPFKDWLEDYEFEVLGNIHANPELLNEVE